MKERSLILFTILAQMAVGAYLTLGGLHLLLQRQVEPAAADALTGTALLAIGPVIGLSILTSLFHLGTPGNAYRAVVNWRSSWLSREILFTLLFAGSWTLYVALWRAPVGLALVRGLVGWIGAFAGVALVYSMSRLYMLRTLPAWNALTTPLSFFTTMFLLGSLAVGAVIAFQAFPPLNLPAAASLRQALWRTALSDVSLFWLLLLGLAFITLPLAAAQISRGRESRATRWQTWIFILRLVLIFTGAGGIGWLVHQRVMRPGPGDDIAALALAALGLVLVAEILGRFLFYESRHRHMAG